MNDLETVEELMNNIYFMNAQVSAFNRETGEVVFNYELDNGYFISGWTEREPFEYEIDIYEEEE